MWVSINLWYRQFTNGLIELFFKYEKFKLTREVKDLDEAMVIHESICMAYKLETLDLLDLVEIGRSLRARQA